MLRAIDGPASMEYSFAGLVQLTDAVYSKKAFNDYLESKSLSMYVSDDEDGSLNSPFREKSVLGYSSSDEENSRRSLSNSQDASYFDEPDIFADLNSSRESSNQSEKMRDANFGIAFPTNKGNKGLLTLNTNSSVLPRPPPQPLKYSRTNFLKKEVLQVTESLRNVCREQLQHFQNYIVSVTSESATAFLPSTPLKEMLFQSNQTFVPIFKQINFIEDKISLVAADTQKTKKFYSQLQQFKQELAQAEAAVRESLRAFRTLVPFFNLERKFYGYKDTLAHSLKAFGISQPIWATTTEN